MIKVTDLTRDYGENRGVFGLSFQVKPGEPFGLLGPNGAGKTTLIRHLMGFLRPRRASAPFTAWTAGRTGSRCSAWWGISPGRCP